MYQSMSWRFRINQPTLRCVIFACPVKLQYVAKAEPYNHIPNLMRKSKYLTQNIRCPHIWYPETLSPLCHSLFWNFGTHSYYLFHPFETELFVTRNFARTLKHNRMHSETFWHLQAKFQNHPKPCACDIWHGFHAIGSRVFTYSHDLWIMAPMLCLTCLTPGPNTSQHRMDYITVTLASRWCNHSVRRRIGFGYKTANYIG